MLSCELVQEIRRLLCEGELSQRKIAARLGVSHGIVGAIASGRRGADEASRSRAAGRYPVRCRRCGYRVYLPCLICKTRDYRQQQLAQVKPASNQVQRRKRRPLRARRAN